MSKSLNLEKLKVFLHYRKSRLSLEVAFIHIEVLDYSRIADRDNRYFSKTNDLKSEVKWSCPEDELKCTKTETLLFAGNNSRNSR